MKPLKRLDETEPKGSVFFVLLPIKVYTEAIHTDLSPVTSTDMRGGLHDAGHPSTGRISVVPSALNTSGLGV
ncbi:hypothetical protein P3T33_001194 [Rhizobium sp. AN67]|nr:hypothetical protein [Rhizobium sp. AN67]SOD59014.1 hypothetical protein SAMN05216595_4597 [Rhizobium sp. AN6A]